MKGFTVADCWMANATTKDWKLVVLVLGRFSLARWAAVSPGLLTFTRQLCTLCHPQLIHYF